MFIDPHSLQKINADAWKNSDMKFYDATCNTDSDLQSFDATLRNRTSRAVNSIVSGVEFRSISLDSLKDATSSLLEMNYDVAMAILQNKKDIWKNRQLFLHVEDYFQSSLQTLDFCTSLEKCLNRYHTNLSLLDLALQHFDKEHSGSIDGIKYSKILDELKNYKEAEVSFTEEFFTLFESVHRQQVSMLQKLHQRKGKINRKLKSMRTWRRISNIIFASAMAALLICSVVAVIVAAPPVLAAIVAAVTVPLDATGKWFTSMWKKYEDTVLGEKEIVRLMELGTRLTIKDLSNIGVAVDLLLIKMESIVAVADMRIREEEMIKIGVDEMRKNVGVCIDTIVDLGHRADKCNRVVGRARRVVLHRIVRHHSM